MFRQAKAKKAVVKKNKQERPYQHRRLLEFMALAYLPEDLILTTYKTLKEKTKRDPHIGATFDAFFKYYEDTWLRDVSQFCVYRLKFATNNYLETYHRMLKRYLGKKPNTNHFFCEYNIFYLAKVFFIKIFVDYVFLKNFL